jgi:hypothetical protein
MAAVGFGTRFPTGSGASLSYNAGWRGGGEGEREGGGLEEHAYINRVKLDFGRISEYIPVI